MSTYFYNMPVRMVFAVFATLCFWGNAEAGGQEKTTEKAGTALALALPVTAGAITLYKQDWDGSLQLFVSTALTVGTAYGLKQIVHEQRPDHSNYGSFPSDTAALAFAPAQFLWQRYGWEYGVPAYAVAGFVGYSRVDARKHHWWDVAASAGISLGYNAWVTRRFRSQDNFSTSLQTSPDSVLLTADMHW